jgi:hypothetical protein
MLSEHNSLLVPIAIGVCFMTPKYSWSRLLGFTEYQAKTNRKLRPHCSMIGRLVWSNIGVTEQGPVRRDLNISKDGLMWQNDYSALYSGIVRTFQLGILWALDDIVLIGDLLLHKVKAGIS